MHAAIRLPQRIPNLELVIYEKNPEIGGTWYENRYPGVACDVPAHSYTLVYEPNVEWSEFYASGQEIERYLQKVADKYKVRRFMKFNHKCVGATWDEENGKWNVHVQGPKGEDIKDSCDVLITATGILNNWKWPDIPGIHDFAGLKVHSAVWPDDLDLTGKKVAIIGNGSSAIQITPKLQKIVERLDLYARGSTWISPPLAGSKVEERNPGGGNSSAFDMNKLIVSFIF
jgi:cation diffusion facilitator CzcD-associated flavoprotein CzcO